MEQSVNWKVVIENNMYMYIYLSEWCLLYFVHMRAAMLSVGGILGRAFKKLTTFSGFGQDMYSKRHVYLLTLLCVPFQPFSVLTY